MEGEGRREKGEGRREERGGRGKGEGEGEEGGGRREEGGVRGCKTLVISFSITQINSNKTHAQMRIYSLHVYTFQ